MNYGELKATVSAYCSRKPSDFDSYGIDLLKFAIRNARRWAERTIDFEFSRQPVRLPSVSISTGALLTACVDAAAAPVLVKSVERAWTADTSYNPQMPLEIMNKANWDRRMKQRYTANIQERIDLRNWTESSFTGPPTLIQQGQRLFLKPSDTTIYNGSTTNLVLDVVAYLPDYTDDDDTDFLMDHAFDWYVWRCVQELNFFLKEDQRVQINNAIMEMAWLSVRQWNYSLVDAKIESVTLD